MRSKLASAGASWLTRSSAQAGCGADCTTVRAVSLGVVFADVFPAADGARTYAVLRVRAVTEEVEP